MASIMLVAAVQAFPFTASTGIEWKIACSNGFTLSGREYTGNIQAGLGMSCTLTFPVTSESSMVMLSQSRQARPQPLLGPRHLETAGPAAPALAATPVLPSAESFEVNPMNVGRWTTGLLGYAWSRRSDAIADDVPEAHSGNHYMYTYTKGGSPRANGDIFDLSYSCPYPLAYLQLEWWYLMIGDDVKGSLDLKAGGEVVWSRPGNAGQAPLWGQASIAVASGSATFEGKRGATVEGETLRLMILQLHARPHNHCHHRFLRLYRHHLRVFSVTPHPEVLFTML
jgi:hypothetical protein